MVSHNPTAQTPRADTTASTEATGSSNEAHPLEALPPSSEVVYIILDRADGPLTQREIAERSARTLPTIRRALNRLRNETDLIEVHPTGDARESAYAVTRDTSHHNHEYRNH